MADVTIRLVSNPKTGKRDIFIDYESEEDALPFEHEKDHRDVVEKLLGQGILDEDDLGNVVVGRVKPERPRREDIVQEEPAKEAETLTD